MPSSPFNETLPVTSSACPPSAYVRSSVASVLAFTPPLNPWLLRTARRVLHVLRPTVPRAPWAATRTLLRRRVLGLRPSVSRPTQRSRLSRCSRVSARSVAWPHRAPLRRVRPSRPRRLHRRSPDTPPLLRPQYEVRARRRSLTRS